MRSFRDNRHAVDEPPLREAESRREGFIDRITRPGDRSRRRHPMFDAFAHASHGSLRQATALLPIVA